MMDERGLGEGGGIFIVLNGGLKGIFVVHSDQMKTFPSLFV